MPDHEGSNPQTSEAVRATAASRGTEPSELPPSWPESDGGEAVLEAEQFADLDTGFEVDLVRVNRAVYGRPYDRGPSDPLYRPLQIFTLDPAVARRDGSMATVNVPYEPLEPGPKGALFEVDINGGRRPAELEPLQLDDPKILITSGRSPSASDPLFHQQMVYAVCSRVYASFRSALGRHIAWGFKKTSADPAQQSRLRIIPHWDEDANAFYDADRGELCFGYYRASKQTNGMNLPGQYVFTCLSHDIIVHEVTHALLDGLRSQFAFPSQLDVLAFHEGFSDLVAVLQHFTCEDVVRNALQSSGGNVTRAELLTDVARQFGHTTSSGNGQPRALRSSIADPGNGTSATYGSTPPDAHSLGSVLLTAMFSAFAKTFHAKTRRFVRLATGGSTTLPENVPPQLVEILAAQASKLAGQFLNIVIRAIDYCPPVDLEFGEFLRALITADNDLVPDDPWGYREMIIATFGQFRIYPRDVVSLSEDALLWHPPEQRLPNCPDLSFAALRFDGDPARPANGQELCRQARVLGRFVSRPEHLNLFGLTRNGDPRLNGDEVSKPRVHSIRSSRRVGPDGQLVFDLIAEVLQTRRVHRFGRVPMDWFGGSTVILGPRGDVRYVIAKSVWSEDRLQRHAEFRKHPLGQKLWSDDDRLAANHPFKILHDRQSMHSERCML